jgi:hypothetical protein
MQADVYYPITEQGTYGSVKKQWILGKTIACNFSSGGSAFKEEVVANPNITQDSLLLGRVKNDVRVGASEELYGITDIVLSNIRDSAGNIVYIETAGERSSKGTIFEIATLEPIVGPTKRVEYYKLMIRRSQNQGVNL